MNSIKYDTRHGGPFDRGAADSYYGRNNNPHYYVGDTLTSELIRSGRMTHEEKLAYHAGYLYNEKHGDKKNWD